MTPVASGFCFSVDPAERFIVLEGAEQLMVAGSSLVHSGHDGIHDAKAGVRTDAFGGDPVSRLDRPVWARRMLQGPDDRRADGNHAVPTPAGINQRGR